MKKKLYAIANSHIDPVWVWSRASGQYNWINTAHSVVRMMERHPDMKFSCSSSAMYRCIEENSPVLFSEIKELVRKERWEIVGGWEVQSDAIISDTESLIRQGQMGKEYFLEKFGVDVKIAYCVDSFGHSAHLPKIFNMTGFSHYVFLRPMSHQTDLPYLFDWRSEDGSQVRALRIFDTYALQNVCKDEFMDRIAQHIEQGLDHQTLFFGTGDHGGGVYEHHYEWLQEAAREYDIHFATLKEYFEETEKEEVPVIENRELGPVFRGCYSACHEVKKAISISSHRLAIAEKCGIPRSRFKHEWQELLFNNFHDVISGTASYSSCYEDILPALGGVISSADREIRNALCRRSESLDTSFCKEGGLYLWNPENTGVSGIIGVPGYTDPNETGCDFNALVDQNGTLYPLQVMYQTPALFAPCAMPWGRLTAVVPLEPNEEKVLAYTRSESARMNLGFEKQYQTVKKIKFLRFHDDSGTWGFDLVKFIRPEDIAEMVKTEELADGPVCSILRVFYRINHSEIRLDLYRYADVEELKLELRMDWKERLSVLKMAYVFQEKGTSFYTGTPGGEICRIRPQNTGNSVQICYNHRESMYPCSGETSMVEWCALFNRNKATAFYAMELHGCDYAEGALRITLLRTVPYADHLPFQRNEETGYQDMGLQSRSVWLLENAEITPEALPQKVRSRLRNLECAETTAHTKSADFPAFDAPVLRTSDNVVIESVSKRDEGGWELHVLNYGSEEQIELPDGRLVKLPARSLLKITV